MNASAESAEPQTDAGNDRVWTLQASVLTAGEKATVITDTIEINNEISDQHLEKIEMESFNFKELGNFGHDLSSLVLPDLVSRVLVSFKDKPLVIINDAKTPVSPGDSVY